MQGAELLPLIKAASKGDRYSENFMKWVRKNRNREICVGFSQWSNLDGSHVAYDPTKTQPANVLIGSAYPDDPYFFGSRLSSILGKGASAERFAFPPTFKVILLPDWLEGYIKGGKCFIDPEHRYYHDRERWQVSPDGKHRTCVWCGEFRQEKITRRRRITEHFWR